MRAGVEHHVHPVVRGVVSVSGKCAGTTVRIRPVRSAATVHWGVQRRIVHSSGREIVPRHTVVPNGGVVRGHVQRIRRDRHRIGKIHLLPSRGTLPRERRTRQQRSPAAPQVPDMRPGVPRTLVKANPRDISVAVRSERHPQFYWRIRPHIRHRRHRRTRPDRAGTAATGSYNRDTQRSCGGLHRSTRVRHLHCEIACPRCGWRARDLPA